MQKLTTFALLLALMLAPGATHAQAVNPAGQTAMVSGGTFTGTSLVDAYDNYGKLTVTGGTFTSTTNPLTFGLFNGSGGTALVTGGTFDNNGVGIVCFDSTVTLTGATFAQNTNDLLVDEGVVDIYGTSFTGNGLAGGFGMVSDNLTSGSFEWTPVGATQAQTVSYRFNAGGGTINFIQATPEPSAWLAFGLGALGLGALTLRARKANSAT